MLEMKPRQILRDLFFLFFSYLAFQYPSLDTAIRPVPHSDDLPALLQFLTELKLLMILQSQMMNMIKM